MPNWVVTKICFDCKVKELEEIKNFVSSEDSEFDFNKIVPMSKDLAIESSSIGDTGRAYLEYPNNLEVMKSFNGLSEETKVKALELGQKYLDNIKKYGFKDWYDWCIANWGTKWNANDESISWYGNECSFDTAWNCPLKVLLTLSKKFPDVAIEGKYADEDMGYNCGTFRFINGEVDELNTPDGGSDEAMEIYFDTHEWARDEVTKNADGHWEWK